jgi:hypothetical protein
MQAGQLRETQKLRESGSFDQRQSECDKIECMNAGGLVEAEGRIRSFRGSQPRLATMKHQPYRIWDRLPSPCFAWAPLFVAWSLITTAGEKPPLGQFDQTPVNPRDEAYIFTPRGFDRPGVVAQASDDTRARLQVRVFEAGTDKPTFCRVNVVGPDGNFYQPRENHLAQFSLNGPWPREGSGNRPGKAPIRYFGHFFYTDGAPEVEVPPGEVRIEAFKGFEYRPVSLTTNVRAGEVAAARLVLERAIDMPFQGYYSGDPHLHFPRGGDADDQRIFDLLAAEDIHFGVVMCYNETDSYSGHMDRLIMPQLQGLGRRSQRSRGDCTIVSAQEYRSNVYGHLNLFWRDDLVLAGQSLDPNRWPVFGVIGSETQRLGGYAIHAHGGYAQEIYADLAQRATNGVELLQFGIYRGIGLESWYRILNAGFRFSAVGASDYPACRKLGDCQTYVWLDDKPTMHDWLAGLAQGRSFVTTGPVILLEVDGRRPGQRIDLRGDEPHELRISLKARCDVTPITNLQLVVNGKVAKESSISRAQGQSTWLTLDESLLLDESCWIAARAFSYAPSGSPDAESHTNPVYVYLNGKAPYQKADVEWLAARLDEQIAEQQGRHFDQQPWVVQYYRRSRELVDQVRRDGGQAAPADFPE